MSTTTFQAEPGQLRKRRLRRLLLWAAGVSVFLLLLAIAVQRLLISQMRLPRLTLTQSGTVTAVAVMPDGQTIFTGDDSTLDGHGVTAYRPADVFVWEATDGRLVRRLSAFHWRSSGVLTAPDGKSLIASGEACQTVHGLTPYQVIDWGWRSGQKHWMIASGLPISLSPNGRFVGCENGVYDAANGRLVCRTSAHFAEDGQSAFTPDGNWYGLIDDASLDPKTHKERQSSDFEGDEQYLYSTTRLHFWRTDTGKEARDFPFTRVRAFDIAHDGHWLVMASDADDGMINGTDGSVVRRVDMQSEKVLWTRERRSNGPNPDAAAVLNSVAISPNGKYVMLASTDNHLIVLNAQTGRELFRPFVFPARGEVNWAIPGGLAFSADGKTLVSRCGHKTLVWDASVLQ